MYFHFRCLVADGQYLVCLDSKAGTLQVLDLKNPTMFKTSILQVSSLVNLGIVILLFHLNIRFIFMC